MVAALQFLVHLIKQHIGQQRREHAMDTKANFEFDRDVKLNRSLSVLDLRRKR